VDLQRNQVDLQRNQVDLPDRANLVDRQSAADLQKADPAADHQAQSADLDEAEQVDVNVN
jgi:hypothetical protein